MAITTYSELQTALSNWMERTDLTARYPEFIAVAESEMRRDLARLDLRLREMETRTDLAPTSGVCTLPTDFMAVKSAQARTTLPRRLEYKSPDWLDEAYPDGASGNPSFFTIVGASLYMFPLTTSSIRLTYYAYPAVLSDAATTNWLLTKYPDVYLWGALKQFAVFLYDDQNTAKFATLYGSALAALKSAAMGSRMSPGTSRTASQAAQ